MDKLRHHVIKRLAVYSVVVEMLVPGYYREKAEFKFQFECEYLMISCLIKWLVYGNTVQQCQANPRTQQSSLPLPCTRIKEFVLLGYQQKPETAYLFKSIDLENKNLKHQDDIGGNTPYTIILML